MRPETYRDAMGTADAVVTSVGVLPLPSLTHEEVVRGNGDTNVVPARTAKELGVDRLVVVGASIPPFVPGVAFGVPGLFEVGYAKGKKMALAFARDEFVGEEKTRRRRVQPGGLWDAVHRRTRAAPLDRHVPGVASAARRARERRSRARADVGKRHIPPPLAMMRRSMLRASRIANLRLLREFHDEAGRRECRSAAAAKAPV